LLQCIFNLGGDRRSLYSPRVFAALSESLTGFVGDRLLPGESALERSASRGSSDPRKIMRGWRPAE
jgi:hypothetical protein